MASDDVMVGVAKTIERAIKNAASEIGNTIELGNEVKMTHTRSAIVASILLRTLHVSDSRGAIESQIEHAEAIAHRIMMGRWPGE